MSRSLVPRPEVWHGAEPQKSLLEQGKRAAAKRAQDRRGLYDGRPFAAVLPSPGEGLLGLPGPVVRAVVDRRPAEEQTQVVDALRALSPGRSHHCPQAHPAAAGLSSPASLVRQPSPPASGPALLPSVPASAFTT